MMLSRRGVLLAGGTLAAALPGRKPRAAEVPPLRLHPFTPPETPPQFTFTDAAGRKHDLAEYRGDGVVLNFWATWCTPCVAELPFLAMLAQALAPDRVKVLPISSDTGGAATVRAFYAAHGIKGLPVLLDPDGAAQQAFKLSGIPVTFLIDATGKMRAAAIGAQDWGSEAAIRRVRALIAPNPVTRA